MRKLKKPLSMLLALIMLFSVIAGSTTFSYAADDIFDYQIVSSKDKTIMINGCKRPTSRIVIPEKIDGYTVVALDEYAFHGASWLVEVTIPGTIKELIKDNFGNCGNLKKITVNEGVEKIEYGAFFNSENIESITLPDSLNYLEENFKDTKFYKNPDNWKNGLLFIGHHIVGSDKSYSKLTIPNGTLCLSPRAFNDCRLVKSITIPDGVVYIGTNCFNYCIGLESITIGNGVKTISYNAFRNCQSLKSISLPSSVTTIDELAFASCYSLESANLGDNLRYINDNAFDGCEKLNKISIPDSVLKIGRYAFQDTGYEINESNWDEGVLYIGNHLVSSKKFVTDVIVRDGTKCIADYAFNGMGNLCSIELADTVTSIGYNSFAKTNIYKINIPESCVSIGRGAFFTALLESVTLPKSVASIDEYAFACSGLKKVVINNPKCDISMDDSTFSKTAVIYGHDGSTAQEYTKENRRSFASLCKYSRASLTKATVSKSGKIVDKCQECGHNRTTTIYYPKTITFSTSKYTYDGKAKKPSVTVKGSDGKTISSSNYTVTYPSGRKAIGKYTCKIAFKGNYSGTASKSFTIVPKSTSISSLTASSKGFTVKWKKQATQTTGYQIQIATDSKFTKGVKSYTISKNSTTSKKITKLTGNKKYYVRVRTYKTVSGTKYYSSYSGSKSVTTKR